MKTQGLTISLRSDLVSSKHWEDGSTVYSLVWYVVAEGADGHRWAHHHNFVSRTTGHSETDRAPEKAVRFLDRVNAADSIDIYQWEEIEPRFGSARHEAQPDAW